MGKSWKVAKHGNKGGNNNDMSSCRGHAVVLATCDTNREREGSKELVNLLLQAMDKIYAEMLREMKEKISADNSEIALGAKVNNDQTSSIQQLLADEIMKVKSQSTRHIISVFTDIKGIILAKIQIDHVCPIKLTNEIFERILREKKPISKYCIRLMPLQKCFFPREDEFLEALYDQMLLEYPGVSLPKAITKLDEYREIKRLRDIARLESKKIESVEDECNSENDSIEQASKKQRIDNPANDIVGLASIEVKPIYVPIPCALLFKSRNHTILTKDSVLEHFYTCLPPFIKPVYSNANVSFFVLLIFKTWLSFISWVFVYNVILVIND